MPKGPKGQKRPAAVVSNAIKVARLANGEEDEAMPKRPRRPTVVMEFSGKRPKGDIVDGSQEYLDALDQARLEADDETRPKTLDELAIWLKSTAID
jgi:hypothetical protein